MSSVALTLLRVRGRVKVRDKRYLPRRLFDCHVIFDPACGSPFWATDDLPYLNPKMRQANLEAIQEGKQSKDQPELAGTESEAEPPPLKALLAA